MGDRFGHRGWDPVAGTVEPDAGIGTAEPAAGLVAGTVESVAGTMELDASLGPVELAEVAPSDSESRGFQNGCPGPGHMLGSFSASSPESS